MLQQLEIKAAMDFHITSTEYLMVFWHANM